ncbi:MAG: DUF423 domain-containing protein [Spirochaetota bacterium]
MNRQVLLFAAISGFVGVALGAFGAHALKDTMEKNFWDAYQTGNRYQMYHTIVIFSIQFLQTKQASILLAWSLRLFVIGICLFSGSLYLLAIFGWNKLGIITPIGGVSLLVAWTLLALHLWRVKFTNEIQ